MKTEFFAPTVLIDGKTYAPEGWMWILAFAFQGIPWAVKKVLDPEFDLETKIRRHELRRRLYFRREHLEHLEGRIKETRAEIEAIAKELRIE